jgi:hypothetical protein
MRDGYNALVFDNGASDCHFDVGIYASRNAGIDINQATNIHVQGQAFQSGGTADVTIGSSATECRVDGDVRSRVNNGTRCVINGRSPNSGDPNSTGDWNGNHSLAINWGVMIEDTSNSNLYYPKSDGTFSQVGS